MLYPTLWQCQSIKDSLPASVLVCKNHIIVQNTVGRSTSHEYCNKELEQEAVNVMMNGLASRRAQYMKIKKSHKQGSSRDMERSVIFYYVLTFACRALSGSSIADGLNFYFGWDRTIGGRRYPLGISQNGNSGRELLAFVSGISVPRDRMNFPSRP